MLAHFLSPDSLFLLLVGRVSPVHLHSHVHAGLRIVLHVLLGELHSLLVDDGLVLLPPLLVDLEELFVGRRVDVDILVDEVAHPVNYVLHRRLRLPMLRLKQRHANHSS